MARLGTVRPSQRLTSTPAPQVNRDAFGAGIARGLQGTASALAQKEASEEQIKDAQTSVDLAYKQRNEKVARARVNASLIRMSTELDQELVQMKRDAPADPQNFTNQYEGHIRKRLEEFKKGIPADLRPEFEDQLARVEGSLVTNAFNFEIEGENRAFVTSVTELRQKAVDQIMMGESDMETWGTNLSTLLEDSPLTEADTYDLQQETMEMLQRAQLHTDLEAEASSPELTTGTTGGPADGSDVVAAGLPGQARGLLNTIAGTESPGYNVMHGGATFSDYSKHPNKPQRIQSGPHKGELSTAAGRYQFIYSTWLKAKNALGLKDFSPESQDRAAWWLAQQDYRSRTGRNLSVDLQSGDPTILASVRKALGSTWEGLAKQEDADFVQGVSGKRGTPSQSIYADAYSSVPFTDRLKMWDQAQTRARQLEARQDKEFQAAQQKAMDDMIYAIRAGGPQAPTMDNINQMAQDYRLGVNDYDKVKDEFEEQNARQITVGEVTSEMANPYYAFEGSDEKERDRVGVWAEENMMPSIVQMDQEGMNNTVIPAIQRFGFVPENVETTLARLSQSTNTQAAEFAFQALSDIQGLAPQVFQNGFSDKIRSDVRYYSAMKGLVPDEELWREMASYRDPAQATQRNQFADLAEKNFTDEDLMSDFLASNIADQMDLEESFADRWQESAIEREFRAIYQREFVRYRDHDKAYKAAGEALKDRWGTTRVGGRSYTMRYPPEQSPAYKPYKESYDYMEEQIRSDFGLTDTQGFKLISDGHTEDDVKNGRPPRYQVLLEQVNEEGTPTGVFVPAMETDAQGNPTGYPQHMRFEYTEEMQANKVDDFQWRNQRYNQNLELGHVQGSIEDIENEFHRRWALMNPKPENATVGGILGDEVASELKRLREVEQDLLGEIDQTEEQKPAYTKELEKEKSRDADRAKELTEIIRNFDSYESPEAYQQALQKVYEKYDQ